MNRALLPSLALQVGGRALPRMVFVPAGRGEGEIGRQGDRERGRQGEQETVPPLSHSPPPLVSASPAKRGRPPLIVGPRKEQLLHILRRGQSRQHAAERLGVDPATIARAIRRDRQLLSEVLSAEQEGDKFLAIYDKLTAGRETVLEPFPVIDTPELEREKEYLIACGVPAKRIRRVRLRRAEDGPPPAVQRSEPGERVNRDLKVRPWRRAKGEGRRKSE